MERGGTEETATKDTAASANLHGSRKGQWRREQAPCPLPTKVILVYCLWVPSLQEGHPCIEICCSSLFPVGFFLVVGNKGENVARTELPIYYTR